jgi:diaminohydroxyphosphoribosylaminopyrimidine deaminase/5-amino-6-(5-phosphoribosylamino)uracil reductase
MTSIDPKAPGKGAATDLSADGSAAFSVTESERQVGDLQKQELDEKFMREALKLAEAGRFSARPNPVVGCVLVQFDPAAGYSPKGTIVGRGSHLKAGGPHAEVHALAAAGSRARGSTAYVTLEPCAHFGRTPPCCDALIRAGVKRVVIASHDPNPQVSGEGVRRLEAAGVEVTSGVLAADADALNTGFLRTISGGLPLVTLKVAMSLDGRVAMQSGESQWITGEAARSDVQTLRASAGAIITGSGTVLADDPRLSVRAVEGLSAEQIAELPPALIVVVDRRGTSFTPDLNLLKGRSKLWWVVAPDHLAKVQLAVDEAGCTGQVTVMPDLGLCELLVALAKRADVRDVLVEAGSGLSSSFLSEGLVDQLVIYQAPMLLGASARPCFNAEISSLSEAICLGSPKVEQVGADLKISYTLSTS